MYLIIGDMELLLNAKICFDRKMVLLLTSCIILCSLYFQYAPKNCNVKLATNFCAAKRPFLIAWKITNKRPLQKHRQKTAHMHAAMSINRGRHSSWINDACKESLNAIYCNSNRTKYIVRLIATGKETAHGECHLDDTLTSKKKKEAKLPSLWNRVN